VDDYNHYYFIYETENVDFYLQYASKLPQNARQVNVLEVPYGCKYVNEDEDEETMTNEEDCWEAHLADGVQWLYNEFKIPNDADPGTALCDYKPDLSYVDVLIDYLKVHGIETRMIGLPPSCRLIELKKLGEGVEHVGGVDISYKDIVGFEYCHFYDDPWPTATRIQKLRVYLGVAKKILGDVSLDEIAEELKTLSEDEVLAVAAAHDDKSALEILRRTGVKPSKFWLLDQKPGLIPYYADEVVARTIEELKGDAGAYENPYRYRINEKILAVARRELVEEYNELMKKVMEKHEEWLRVEEERRRREEEEERRRRAEEVARRVVGELARRGVSVEVEVDGTWVRVRSRGYLGKGRFNEFVRTVKSLGFKFEPRGKYWYYHA
jgi:hypothetical protein